MILNLIHIILAIILLFLTNWIGKNSKQLGYHQITFSEEEDTPAFNILYRAMAPNIYIFLLAFIFYKLNISEYSKNIYLVTIYYFIIRFSIIFIIGRYRLTNWPRQILISLLAIIISYILNNQLFEQNDFPLPTKQEITTAFWFAVIGFLYKLINNLSYSRIKDRESDYILHTYGILEKKYGDLITNNINNKIASFPFENYQMVDSEIKIYISDKLHSLIYSILIYENFNRHILHRIVEKLLFWTKRIKSTGIMQVKSEKYLTDEESISRGSDLLISKYFEVFEAVYSKEKDCLPGCFYTSRRESIKFYNPDKDYINEVESIHTNLESKYPLCSDITCSYTKQKDVQE